MKKFLPLFFLLATLASAQSTVTLSNSQGVTRSNPAGVNGGAAVGSDGVRYSWVLNSITTYTSDGALLTTCSTPYLGAFAIFDLTPPGPNALYRGPYTCGNGQVIGIVVKYQVNYVPRTKVTSYYVLSGTATIQ